MTIDGFIPLKKPLDMTSQQAVSRVKRIVGSKKAGHTGTLDPAAEGLLLIALGRATRLSEYFLMGDKGYRAEITFGIATDSDDREGAVIDEQSEFCFTKDQIEAILPQFIGAVSQVPPAASAIKINGKRAYELYRQGESPQMAARQVKIHSISLVDPPLQINAANPVINIEVNCGKGTYIRSLARDIGVALGCPSHMSALVRTSMSDISIAQAATLDELESDYSKWLLDISIAVSKLPRVEISGDEAVLFYHGRSLEKSGPDGDIAVFCGDALLGIARPENGKIKPVKVLTQG